MTDAETIHQGQMAEDVLTSNAFNELFALVADRLSKDILATPLSEQARREEMFLTYHGMRSFSHFLQAYVIAKDNVVAANKALNNPEDDDTIF